MNFKGTMRDPYHSSVHTKVNDFRNDVILAAACRDDVDKFCKDVEPGRFGC